MKAVAILKRTYKYCCEHCEEEFALEQEAIKHELQVHICKHLVDKNHDEFLYEMDRGQVHKSCKLCGLYIATARSFMLTQDQLKAIYNVVGESNSLNSSKLLARIRNQGTISPHEYKEV